MISVEPNLSVVRSIVSIETRQSADNDRVAAPSISGIDLLFEGYFHVRATPAQATPSGTTEVKVTLDCAGQGYSSEVTQSQ